MKNDIQPVRTVQGYSLERPIPRRMVAIQHLAAWKNSNDNEYAWLYKLIGGAMQTFTVMALNGQPAAEMLPMTAQVWVDILIDMNLTEELDRGRVETGIRKLNRMLKERPQVSALIAEMPRREAPSTMPGTVNVQPGCSVEAETAGLAALAKWKEDMGI